MLLFIATVLQYITTPTVPYAVLLFHWTPEIIQHLAEHGVSQEEFETVVAKPDEVVVSRTSERLIAFGHGSDGRLLACVYDLLGDDVIPVTAYEPTI
jgi:uncharacterized DUF497 family protein